MFCSSIIPTVGRTSLCRAVLSVLDQSFSSDDFEVIVVNDTGKALPEADWQSSDRVQVIHTNRRERSVARNAGAAIAKGEYLHFLDDDDWLLPGALETFWKLSQSSVAGWLFGGTQLIRRNGEPLIKLNHNFSGNCFSQLMSGEWIPLQASLIKSEAFFSVGGFHPLVMATQDIHLSRRIALNWDFDGTNEIVACVEMGESGSTTDYKNAPVYSRWAREFILNEPNTFSRFLASANNSYWHGRVVRAYATSVIWNLDHMKLFAALSRLFFTMVSFLMFGRSLLNSEYWVAILKAYESPTFIKGFEEMGFPVERRQV